MTREAGRRVEVLGAVRLGHFAGERTTPLAAGGVARDHAQAHADRTAGRLRVSLDVVVGHWLLKVG